MPLRKGKSRKVVSHNIGELMRSYGKKHKIGNTRPRSKKQAQRIAVAIALSKARRRK